MSLVHATYCRNKRHVAHIDDSVEWTRFYCSNFTSTTLNKELDESSTSVQLIIHENNQMNNIEANLMTITYCQKLTTMWTMTEDMKQTIVNESSSSLFTSCDSCCLYVSQSPVCSTTINIDALELYCNFHHIGDKSLNKL